MLETLRIGNACSEVWAKERSIALGLNREVALGVVCRGHSASTCRLSRCVRLDISAH